MSVGAGLRARGRTAHRSGTTPQLVVGISIVAVVVLGTVLAPLLAPYDPNAVDLGSMLSAPSIDPFHPFGTDQVGRDVLSRVLYGGRAALIVGLFSTLIAVTLGVLFGLLAATGRTVDAVIGRIADIQLSIPGLVLALLALSLFGTTPLGIIIIIGLEWWPMHYRVVRDKIRELTASPFVEASRLGGSGRLRTFGGHILPHLIPVLAVTVTFNVSTAVLAESGLSYLGLGSQPPTANWGLMIAESRTQLGDAWWGPVFPGLALVVFLIGVQMVGDALSRRFAATGRGGVPWI
ncbi:ABC transporter permease [Mycetocola tolaasinivorans]|uniref:ABC transporter permease n=1 Tax=Mycetocola tolaasinivorans TaxID=76635 RepID=A0A3L7ABZ3_9MICO|nr:ABC transporter permease [Mycetocola tolaasinivorans]RLP77525.1 ABC transporter permease [Mycetocola tolaasinivorans]